MSRARNRPPKLESRAPVSSPAPPPTLEQQIERSKIAGTSAAGPGPTEFRRIVERLSVGDRRSLGELAEMPGLKPADAWSAVTRTFGATAGSAAIDASCTLASTHAAIARVLDVARNPGARVAIATARPASLLTLHFAFAALARTHGADVVDLADVGPIRADGRTPRWLRWVGGVAVVSDSRALCDSRDGEAAREWMFAIPRPALVIADGPFAEVAWESGVEVVAMAGLDRPGLAVAAAMGDRCTVVPMHTDRPARAYRPIERLVLDAETASGTGPDTAPDVDLTRPPSPSDPEV